MNRSQFNRRVRYADGGPVGAGISDAPLFDFGSDPYQMPIPSKGYEAGYRDQFALSNYPDPYLTDSPLPPTPIPEDQIAKEQLELERKGMDDKFSNLQTSYGNWLTSFQPKYLRHDVDKGNQSYGGIPGIGVYKTVPVWDQFQSDLVEYDKLASDFRAKNRTSLKEYKPPQLARDDLRESGYVQNLWTMGFKPRTYTPYGGLTADQMAQELNGKPVTYADGGIVGSIDPAMAQTGFQNGNLSYSNDQMKEITNLTVAAIKGEVGNAESIIQQFISIFGQEEFNRLVQALGQGAPADEGPVSGPGGPRDDSIPAVINGMQPARLSDGEYIIPADAVAGIGDGDPELGNERLNQMVSNSRSGAGIA